MASASALGALGLLGACDSGALSAATGPDGATPAEAPLPYSSAAFKRGSPLLDRETGGTMGSEEPPARVKTAPQAQPEVDTGGSPMGSEEPPPRMAPLRSTAPSPGENAPR